jgi:hypothetical protein
MPRGSMAICGARPPRKRDLLALDGRTYQLSQDKW